MDISNALWFFLSALNFRPSQHTLKKHLKENNDCAKKKLYQDTWRTLKKNCINRRIRTSFFVLISCLVIWEFLFNVKTIKLDLASLGKGVDNKRYSPIPQDINIWILKNAPESLLSKHHINPINLYKQSLVTSVNHFPHLFEK